MGCTKEADISDYFSTHQVNPSSAQCSQDFTGDPVNVVTGAFTLAEQDILIPTQRLHLDLTRHYNNQLHDDGEGRPGPFGRGWTHTYNMRLSPGAEPTQQTYLDDQGNSICFEYSEDLAAYVPPPGSLGLSLEKNGGGLVLRQIDGLRAVFDLKGRVVAITKPGPSDESRINLEYDEDGRLISAAGTGGRFIRFEYGRAGDALIRSACDHTGRRWDYYYDDQHQLIEVVDPAARVRRYAYDTKVVLVSKAKGETEKRAISAMSKVFTPFYRGQSGEPTAEVTNQYTSDRRIYQQTDALGGLTRFDYNRFTKTTCVTDPGGWTTVYCYDTAGNTTKVRRPGGGSTEYIFDVNRNLLAEIDPQSNRTEYVDFNSPDCLGRAEEFGRRALGNRSDYVTLSDSDIRTGYDRLGNRPLVRDALGNTTRFFDYTPFGRPRRVELPDGSEILYEYDGRSGLQTRSTQDLHVSPSCLLRVTEESNYDGLGNLTRFAEWAETAGGERTPTSVIEIKYDSFGNHPVLKRTWVEAGEVSDRFAAEETYEWDDLGRMVALTVLRRYEPESEPKPLTTRFGYDILGRQVWAASPGEAAVVRELDPEGRVTEEYRVADFRPEGHMVPADLRLGRVRWEHDALGRVGSVTEPGGAVTQREWDSRGYCSMETDSAGYAIQFEYDRDGNQTVRRTTGGYELHTSYDLNGRPTAESDNLGMHRRYQYDPLGRVREVVDGEGSLASSTIYLYEAPGRGVRVERPDGTFEFVEHNERGRPIRREWGARGSDSILVEIFTHDVFDRLVRVDAGAKDGLVTKFSATYLDDKRESAVFDALGNVTRTVYDSEGRPAHKTDAEGRKLSYEYDEAGRITRRRAEDGSVHSSYEYDALGRRVAAHEGAVSHSWRFDGGGRVVCHEQRVGSDAGAISYEYDDAGRLTGKAYDDEWWMRFEYHANSHFVNRVLIPGATIDLTVDPSGRILREGWGDSGHTVYEYSPGGPLSVVDHFDGRGRLIFGQSFEHDYLGRPSRETRRNGAGEVTYLNRYDPFNRLERVDTADSGSAAEFRRYVYDEWGNRLEEYRGGELYAAFCYDTADRLTEKRDSRGDIERHEYDKCGNLIRKGSQSCRYDSAQRLREVTNVAGGADIISFGYSATDIRVTVERADVAEHLFYDDLQEIISSLPRERTLTFWGFTLDTLLAASDSSKSVRKAFTNSQGSVVGFEGAEHLEDYDPFGVPLSGDRLQLRFGFCGKRYDSETSLYYNRARFYDPDSGRFTQPDAKGLVDGTNLFTYVNSNPVTFNDTLGFKSSKSSQGRVARAYDSLFSPQLDITSMRGLKMAHYDPAGHKVGTTYFKEKSLFKTERLEHYNLEGEKIGETYFKEKSLFDVGHLRHYTPGGELSGKSYYKESTFFNPSDRLQHYDVNSEIVGKTYFQPRTFTQLPHFEHYRPDRSPYDFIRKPMGSSYIMKA